MLSVSKRLRTLYSCLSWGRELLFISHPWCQIPRIFQCPFHSTIPCQGHLASRGKGHWGGGTGLLCLPYHLSCYPQGQPSWDLWHIGYAYHVLLGNAPTFPLLNIPLGYPLLNQKLPCRLFPPLLQQWLDLHLGPSGNTTFLTGWRLHPHLWLPPMWLPRSHPAQSGRRKHPSITPWQGVSRKLSAGIPS